MTRNRKRRGDLADITDGATSPLDVATTARAGQTLDMVRAAVERGDTMLAFQPVLGLRPPHGTKPPNSVRNMLIVHACPLLHFVCSPALVSTGSSSLLTLAIWILMA